MTWVDGTGYVVSRLDDVNGVRRNPLAGIGLSVTCRMSGAAERRGSAAPSAATCLTLHGVLVWEAPGFPGMSEVLPGTYEHPDPDFLHGAANAITSRHRVSVLESVVDLESVGERRQKA